MATLKIRLPETIAIGELDDLILYESTSRAITALLAQALAQGDATWTPENHPLYRQAKAGLDVYSPPPIRL